MATPNESETSSERQIFERLISTAKGKSKWEKITGFMSEQAIDPDTMFSIATRCTIIAPNNLRSLRSGNIRSNWDGFKLDVIREIVEKELEIPLNSPLRKRLNQPQIPPSPQP